MKFINYLNKLLNYKYFFLLLFLGLLIFSYPMLVSNFDFLPGNSIDIKSFSYILEHSFRWLTNVPTHEEFWSPPFFYPTKNTLAFSDAFIGIMPVYWLIRAFFQPLEAIQMLVVALCLLNYSSFYYLLRKRFNFNDLASSFGAYLFAFSVLRYYKMVHLNYYSQYLTIFALILFLGIDKNKSRKHNHLCFLGACFFMALQFYTCYSYGYFSFLILFFGIIFALFFKNYRIQIFDFIKTFKIEIIIYSIIFTCTLIPLAQHYIAVGKVRQLTDVYTYLQSSLAWIRSLSVIDCAILKDIFPYIGPADSEEANAGIGIFTTIFALIGLFLFKKHKWLLLFLMTFIFFASCEVGSFILWEYLYYIPGANGIRAIIRFSLMGLIILSISTAFLFEYLKKINKTWANILFYLIGLLIVIEQIPHCFDPNSEWKNYSWSKSTFNKQLETYCGNVPEDKSVIYVVVDHYQSKALPTNSTQYMYGYSICELKVNSTAIWCGMKTNKYMINGLSGVSYSTEIPEDIIKKTHYIVVPCDSSTSIFNYDR